MSKLFRLASVAAVTFSLCAAPAAAQAAPSKQQKAEAKRLHRLVAKNVGSVGKSDKAKLEEIAEQWQAETQLCTGELEQSFASISQERQVKVLFTMLAVELLDVLQEMTPVAEPTFKQGQRVFLTVKLRDRQLKAMAKAKTRQIGRLLKLPDIDTCGLMTEWAQGEFADEHAPAGLSDLLTSSKAQQRDEKAIARGEKRLRAFGLSAKQAALVAQYPFGKAIPTAGSQQR